MELTAFSFISLALTSILGLVASFYLLKRIRGQIPENNVTEIIAANKRYWIGGFVVFFIVTQIFENKLEARFVSDPFIYVEERSKIMGIALFIFIASATVHGYLSSNLPRQDKFASIAVFFMNAYSLTSLFILAHVVSDYYFSVN